MAVRTITDMRSTMWDRLAFSAWWGEGGEGAWWRKSRKKRERRGGRDEKKDVEKTKESLGEVSQAAG